VSRELLEALRAALGGRLIDQAPGALKAYKKLLKHQPDAYRTHVKWLKNFAPEEVRLAMLRVRRSGESATVASFEQYLQEAKTRLQEARGRG
jgi:hypothetical protein